MGTYLIGNCRRIKASKAKDLIIGWDVEAMPNTLCWGGYVNRLANEDTGRATHKMVSYWGAAWLRLIEDNNHG